MPRRPAERPAAARSTAARRVRRSLLAAAPLAGALLCPAIGSAQEDPPPAAATGAEPTDAPNPLAAEPTDVAEFVSAAARLRRIGRPGLARRYLQTLLERNPSDDELLAARDELGPAIFFELSTDLQLRPEGQTLQTRVREAVVRRGADPARLDGLIDALVADPRERGAATAALVGLSDAATPRLVERLIAAIDPVDGDEGLRGAITRLLGRLGEDSVPPLRAVLRSRAAPAEARSAVAAALGETGAQSALDALLAPAFAPGEPPPVQLAARSSLAALTNGAPLRGLSDAAVTRLKKRAEQLLVPRPAADAQSNAAAGPEPLYRYDAAENRLLPVALPPAIADRYEAASLASDAADVAPSREDLKALELTAALAYEAALVGRGKFLPRGEGTVHRAALAAGPDRLLGALDRALDLGANGAAAAALQILLDVPTPDLLRPVGAAGSPVTRALRSPAAEVRFLAALLIARSDPDPGFAEGDTVVDVLAGALADAPGGRAVVIDPNPERGSRMAGLLQGLGYRVDLQADARDGFERAAAGAGADLIAVHARVQGMGVSALAANFRADARTRSVPLALYGEERLEQPLGRIAARAGEAAFVPFPIAPETFERKLAGLRAASEPLPDELKADQRLAAAYELSRLAGRDVRGFPLQRALAELSAAVADPAVSADASAALAVIPAPAAQNTLAEVLTVIRPGADGELAAADALTRSVRRFGSLLSPTATTALERRAAGETDPRLRDRLLLLDATLPGGSTRVPVQVALPQE